MWLCGEGSDAAGACVDDRMQRAKRLKGITEAEKKAQDKLDKVVDGWVVEKRKRRLDSLKAAVAAQVCTSRPRAIDISASRARVRYAEPAARLVGGLRMMDIAAPARDVSS